MDPYWIMTLKVLAYFSAAILAALIVAGVMTSLHEKNGDDMLDDGHDPVHGSPLWFVVKLGFASLIALVCCLLMLFAYVWIISDDIDEGVDRLTNDQQEQGR